MRAYAINSTGTAYSDEVSFTTKSIWQVITIKTDKLSYEDTLVFATCQDEILEQEQILEEINYLP